MQVSEIHVETTGLNYLMAERRPESAWFEAAGRAHKALYDLYKQLEDEAASLSERLEEVNRLQAMAGVYLKDQEPTPQQNREYIAAIQHGGKFWCQRRWMGDDEPADTDRYSSRVEVFHIKNIPDLVMTLRSLGKVQEVWLMEGRNTWRKIA